MLQAWPILANILTKPGTDTVTLPFASLVPFVPLLPRSSILGLFLKSLYVFRRIRSYPCCPHVTFSIFSYRVYCLLGDGECAEGSVWEAMHFASHYKLDNLVAILDINRLGQSEPTSLGHDMETYRKRVDAFG